MSAQHEISPVVSQERETQEPPLYKVILLNDDFTPQDFVVVLLQEVFAMPIVQATSIMLQIHHQGAGICGIYTREISEIKMSQIHAMARKYEHPLRCIIQEA
ncbi:MAG: ATP-dependent Clp protease adapter ClpS [Burkholderiales bacterium]|jgi:ATP-dependent Clp protease adaptor protein ClpS|nr:ATP-dependent Clp protease adapter ClpS [Burkholderiales bacterium]